MNPIKSIIYLHFRRRAVLFGVFVFTLCGLRMAEAAPNEVWESGGQYRWKINNVEKGSSTDLSTAIDKCLWDSGGIGREIHVLTGGDLSKTMTLPGDVKVFFHNNTFNITHNNYGVHGKRDHNVEMHDANFVSGPYYVFRITACNNFLVSGINIDGGGIGMRIESSDSNHPWDFTAYDLTVKNCRFENLSSHGLETFGINRFHVDEIVARNNGQCGVLFNNSRNGYVGTVDAYRCDPNGGYAGLRFANGNSNIRVKYLRAIECGRGFFTTTGAWNIVVEEVYIRNSHSHNILLQDSDAVGINSGSYNGGALNHYTSNNCWINASNVWGVTTSPPAAPAAPTAAADTSGVSLTWPTVSGATNYLLQRASNSGGPYSTIAYTEATAFIDREVAADTTYYYVLRATNAAGPGGTSPVVSASPAAAPAVALTSGLQLHYPFDGSGAEGGGGAAASIAGTATYVPGMISQALAFNGSTNFATLPTLSSASYRDFTVGAWVMQSSTAGFQRVFDFGNGTSNYIMVTRSEYGNLRFELRRNGSAQLFQTPFPPTEKWFHLAVTFTGNWATIYINGTAVKSMLFSNNPVHLTLEKNYIGDSQWPNDPLFKGRIDDFRLYNRGLSKAEVSALARSAPPLPPLNLIAGGFGTRVNLSWQGNFNSSTYNVKRATTSGGPYTTVATGITGTTYSDTTVSSDTTYYYVLSATNPHGESTNSNEASAVISDLVTHVKFDETAGTVATDSSGNGWNGTIVNGASFVSGVLRNALSLPKTNGQFVTFQTGVVSGLNDFTISTWVRISAFETWSRIFDFGTGTDNNMFLTTQYDGSAANARKLQFGIRTPSVDKQAINSSTAISATNTWTHVAITLSGTTGRMYINGVLVGTNSNMTLRPSNLGYTTQNYLGRSQFADPYFNGAIDDFRIYSRALAGTELATLASPMPEAPEAVRILPGNEYVTLNWDVTNAATSYDVLRAANSGGPYQAISTNLTNLTYKDTGLTNETPYFYVVVGKSARGESPPSAEVVGIPSELRLHLKFDELSGATAFDSATGGRHAQVMNGGTWGEGRIENAVQIGGSPQHVELPGGLIEDLPSITVMSWVRLNSLDTYSRIFDFGSGTPTSSTGRYMMLTPSSNNGIRFAITTAGYGSEQAILSSTGTMPIGVWTHVVVTLSGTTGRLYVNGHQVGVNTTMSLNPASLGTITRSYLGRSLFTSDPYLNGALDDFRIYTRALGAAEVDPFATPLQAPQNVVAEGGPQRIDLTWSAVPNADHYIVRIAGDSNAQFEVLAANVTATNFTHNGVTGDPHFYQVSAVNLTGEGPTSAVVSCTATSGVAKQDQWRILHFGTSDPVDDAAQDADPDGDGVCNFLEYALEGDPMVNDRSPLPRGSMEDDHIRLEFDLINDPDILYEVVASENLTNWDMIWSSAGKDLGAGPITVTDAASTPTARQRFLRLRVSTLQE